MFLQLGFDFWDPILIEFLDSVLNKFLISQKSCLLSDMDTDTEKVVVIRFLAIAGFL